MNESNVISIEKPRPTELVQRMGPLVEAARRFEVVDVETDRQAQENGQTLRRAEKDWTEYCEPARRAADAAKKEILALRDGILAPWAEARAIFFRKSDQYQAGEREKARQLERKMQEQAVKQEEERQILAAVEAEADGAPHEAAAILEQSVAVPRVTVAPAVAQVKGVSTRVLWSAEVHDLLELVRYVSSHPEWISLLEPAMPNLNRLAVAQREAMAIPGVRAVSVTSRQSR